MKSGGVPLSEIVEDGGRLTAGFHLSEDQVAVARIRRMADRCVPLRELCLSKRGIFKGPIFRRVFVEDPARGEPYVSSSDLMQAHVEPAGYLSRKHHGALLDDLRLHEGMILLTRSGMNLGSAIWTRRDMDGLCATDDLIRIQPDPERVPPGYLYAFLAGRYGHAWIRKQIYGGSIKHVEPEQVAGMPVPRLGRTLEERVSGLVTRSSELLSVRNECYVRATSNLLTRVGLDPFQPLELERDDRHLGWSAFGLGSESFRALNFEPRSADLWGALERVDHTPLGALCERKLFKGKIIFKRIESDERHGRLLVGQRNAFRFEPSGRFISNSSISSLGLVVPAGTTLVASHGTLGEGELYCRSAYVTKQSAEYAYSGDFFRCVPTKGSIEPGYLFAFMRSWVAFRMLRSISAGGKQQEQHPAMMYRLPVPRLPSLLEAEIARDVERGAEAQDSSFELFCEARSLVEAAIEGAA